MHNTLQIPILVPELSIFLLFFLFLFKKCESDCLEFDQYKGFIGPDKTNIVQTVSKDNSAK